MAGELYITDQRGSADLMNSLDKTAQIASSQNILNALWDEYPGGWSKDTTTRAADPAHDARFKRLVLSIHRQLSRKKIIKTRKTPWRTSVRVRAHRSPASLRRATADSGGDGGGDPEPPPTFI